MQGDSWKYDGEELTPESAKQYQQAKTRLLMFTSRFDVPIEGCVFEVAGDFSKISGPGFRFWLSNDEVKVIQKLPALSTCPNSNLFEFI